MIKLSDYIFKFLRGKGIQHVFTLPGGGSMHLVDSLGSAEGIEFVACLHEQAAAIAAESYGQHTNHLGVALVTTGPGGTNTITGVTAAYIDSTPCMFISGQVKRADLMTGKGVRQMGNQEVDIVGMVKNVTKYAVTVTEPENIRYHLEAAYYEATTGRKGPVWLDIPLDVQSTMIEESSLKPFVFPEQPLKNNHKLKDAAQNTAKMIELAKRPVILAGNGIKLADAKKQFEQFVNNTGIPVLLTWKMIDCLGYDHPLNFGCPGTMGSRAANFILQNADLLLVLGSRLDSSLTAFNHRNFAPRAKKIMVDIDQAEIQKMDMSIDLPLVTDVGDFLNELNLVRVTRAEDSCEPWIEYCNRIYSKYPACEIHAITKNKNSAVDAYVFTRELCQQLKNDDVIVPESAGGAGEITYQAFQVKYGQKIKNAAGLGSMGFGLPYAIGACLANQKRRTVLINGDGAFQLNIQELETVKRLGLPIKIFIWDNGGYVSIANTQRNLFDGHLVASSTESGFTVPSLVKIAEAYGIPAVEISCEEELEDGIERTLQMEGVVLCNVKINPEQKTIPKSMSMKLADGTMVSKPLEDMWPYLSQEELQGDMWQQHE